MLARLSHTCSFSMKSQIFHITFFTSLFTPDFSKFYLITLNINFSLIQSSPCDLQRKGSSLTSLHCINSINVFCESISSRRRRNWDLKSQTQPPKALGVAEPLPRLSLKSHPPPFFPSPIVVQTELHDWAWALVSQILLVEKKLTTEKTTADVCSFFPSPTKTRLQMMSNRGEDEAFGVRAVLHNRRHTQLNFFFFFFCKLFISHLFQTNIICQPFTSR